MKYLGHLCRIRDALKLLIEHTDYLGKEIDLVEALKKVKKNIVRLTEKSVGKGIK